MREPSQTDLFPWILGTILIVAVAVPAAIAMRGTKGTAPPAVAAVVDPAPMNVQPSVVADPAPPPPAAQPSPSASPPPAVVWQCTVDGQRIFSDSPCGKGASVRRLSEVNRMDPTPAPRYPLYTPPPPPAPAYYPAPSAEAPPPGAGNDYDAQQSGLLFYGRARRTRSHESEDEHEERGQRGPPREHVREPRPPHHERSMKDRG